ncbi:MAG: hypothetical protein ACKOXM_07340 [Agromyces sp.]
MQLGTRWAAGSTPPARLCPEWIAAIRDAEANGCSTGAWTLTWLEGYPRIVHDSGREIGVGGTPLDTDEW